MKRYESTRPDVPVDRERLTAIHAAVVEALKGVVREYKITQDELHLAGDFLNRLGQSGMCRSLVDVSLAMTSIDATRRGRGGTRPNLEGPFHTTHPVRPDGDLMDQPPGDEAVQLTLSGVVTDAEDGQPLPGVRLDFWQADHDGHYDHDGAHLRGLVITDTQGRYSIRTVRPRDYSDHDHDPIGELYRAMGRHNRRAAHIHVKAWAGAHEVLNTQLFIAGMPYIDSDYVEGAVSDDLLLHLEPDGLDARGKPAAKAHYDLALVGYREAAAVR
jgi:protocatechuate 3,4-dioxygenase beta subunit